MTKLTQTGVGSAQNQNALLDTDGTGILPIQASGDGATTFRVLGKVSKDAPFIEIKGAGTGDFLEGLSWVPFIALEVTAGAGTVDLYIGDK